VQHGGVRQPRKSRGASCAYTWQRHRQITADIKIVEAGDKDILDITSLFHRFFEEEGFSNTREAIAANIEVMRHMRIAGSRLPCTMGKS
jgi:hypothetical protein